MISHDNTNRIELNRTSDVTVIEADQTEYMPNVFYGKYENQILRIVSEVLMTTNLNAHISNIGQLLQIRLNCLIHLEHLENFLKQYPGTDHHSAC